MPTLPELLSQSKSDIEEISEYFNELLAESIQRVNANFSPQRLSKRTRQVEPLPTDKRQLSSYRTRIGTMLEYALSTEMNAIIEERYGAKYLLTFATAHEYPDFYFRDDTLTLLLRIEMKAVDAESDEQAARFSTPTILIDADKDMLLLIGWRWQDLEQDGEIIGEFPYIFASVILSASEIAKERDVRLEITKGKIEGEKVLVYSEKKREFVPDPGNYGKLWRIIHRTRLNAEDLSDTIRKFKHFLEAVDEHSPRNRLGNKDDEN
ncbi:MAG: hypothetical protein OXI43_20015 [Candidatus Poribacteria bacterium]|nr:hypothetical protein [Candidatus Poribacteria bacterium]